jgi:hypothetical protein
MVTNLEDARLPKVNFFCWTMGKSWLRNLAWFGGPFCCECVRLMKKLSSIYSYIFHILNRFGQFFIYSATRTIYMKVHLGTNLSRLAKDSVCLTLFKEPCCFFIFFCLL